MERVGAYDMANEMVRRSLDGKGLEMAKNEGTHWLQRLYPKTAQSKCHHWQKQKTRMGARLLMGAEAGFWRYPSHCGHRARC